MKKSDQEGHEWPSPITTIDETIAILNSSQENTRKMYMNREILKCLNKAEKYCNNPKFKNRIGK